MEHLDIELILMKISKILGYLYGSSRSKNFPFAVLSVNRDESNVCSDDVDKQQSHNVTIGFIE